MAVRIGTNPIAWSNDDMPELGGDTPLETCLREASEAGFTGIEMGNKFPREPAALRRTLEPFGLSLVSGWYGSELRHRSAEDEIRAMQPHLDLLAAMGSPVMVFCDVSGTVQGKRDTPVANRPVLPDAEWPQFVERLAKAAEPRGRRGVRMAYHPHMGTIVEKAREVDRMLESPPARVGLLFDTGHLPFAGEDPAAVS